MRQENACGFSEKTSSVSYCVLAGCPLTWISLSWALDLSVLFLPCTAAQPSSYTMATIGVIDMHLVAVPWETWTELKNMISPKTLRCGPLN